MCLPNFLNDALFYFPFPLIHSCTLHIYPPLFHLGRPFYSLRYTLKISVFPPHAHNTPHTNQVLGGEESRYYQSDCNSNSNNKPFCHSTILPFLPFFSSLLPFQHILLFYMTSQFAVAVCGVCMPFEFNVQYCI